MVDGLDLSYPNILTLLSSHRPKGRIESRAFLSWFLENYYRLEEVESQDAICDGVDDKGVDGIYVNKSLERIDVFQTKLFQNGNKRIGDVILKEFAGTLSQFSSRFAVEQVISTTGNKELKGLLTAQDVARLVESGYEVRGVFISNVDQDPSALAFLRSRNDITVYDRGNLCAAWVAPGASIRVESAIAFELDGLGCIHYQTPEAEVFVAGLRADDLVKLKGIETQELFDWNVRQSLGKTKVNKAIAQSIKNIEEHKNFLFFHNGLTVLAESVQLSEDRLTIDRYTVVNGCQSLSTLFDNRSSISSEMRLLTRVIQLPPHADLAAKVTNYSNNQNAIMARDLQSNSLIQRRIQYEFEQIFGKEIGYEIKRGERVLAGRIVTNEQAGRMLLAFDLEEPWSCHQTYRLFDELHGRIFGRPEVNAYKIASLDLLEQSVVNALNDMDDQLVAKYSLTKYFLSYLVKKALEKDVMGLRFINTPGDLWASIGGERLRLALDAVVADLRVDLEDELEQRNENGIPFDHKRELKSSTAVRTFASAILPGYEKAIRRNRAASFQSEVEQLQGLDSTGNPAGQ